MRIYDLISGKQKYTIARCEAKCLSITICRIKVENKMYRQTAMDFKVMVNNAAVPF